MPAKPIFASADMVVAMCPMPGAVEAESRPVKYKRGMVMELLRNRLPWSLAQHQPAALESKLPDAFPRPVVGIAIVDLDSAASAAAANDIGSNHRGYGCDVANPNACQDLIKQVLADVGEIDVLVGSPVSVAQPDRIMEVAQERYDTVMNVNVRGTLNMCQAVIPAVCVHTSGGISSTSAGFQPSAAAASLAGRTMQRRRARFEHGKILARELARGVGTKSTRSRRERSI